MFPLDNGPESKKVQLERLKLTSRRFLVPESAPEFEFWEYWFTYNGLLGTGFEG